MQMRREISAGLCVVAILAADWHPLSEGNPLGLCCISDLVVPTTPSQALVSDGLPVAWRVKTLLMWCRCCVDVLGIEKRFLNLMGEGCDVTVNWWWCHFRCASSCPPLVLTVVE